MSTILVAPRETAGCSGVLSRMPPSTYQPADCSGSDSWIGGKATGIAEDARTWSGVSGPCTTSRARSASPSYAAAACPSRNSTLRPPPAPTTVLSDGAAIRVATTPTADSTPASPVDVVLVHHPPDAQHLLGRRLRTQVRGGPPKHGVDAAGACRARSSAPAPRVRGPASARPARRLGTRRGHPLLTGRPQRPVSSC